MAILGLSMVACGGSDAIPEPVCGNGIVEGVEQCDDGNDLDGDGCSPVCVFEACGNGVADPGEVCDDGNNVDGDGCSASCASDETCGNNIVDGARGEACDDGNNDNGDGCASDCTIEFCGNGVAEPGEVCDDGNNLSGDGCSAGCMSDETCGNGWNDSAVGEQCDDGNTDPDDGCSATCKIEFCGNGALETGEVCDDGNNLSGDGCSAGCDSDETCGNGIIDGFVGEACDDGNAVDGDGCSSCTLPSCGDGILDPTEVCDDGNNDDGDGCNATCISNETCGNGILDPSQGEVCEDGNANDGDGCSSICRFEVAPAFACPVDPALFPLAVPGPTAGFGQIAFDSSCNLLVAYGQPSDVGRVDMVTGAVTVLASGVSAGRNLGIAQDPITGLIYTSTDQGEVFEIDAAGTVTLIYTHPNEVEALAIAPSGFGAFGGQLIATTQGGEVIAIDQSAGTVTPIGTSGANKLSSLVFGADGTLYVVNYDQNAIQTVTSGGVFTNFASVTGIDGIAIDDAGGRLFASSQSLDQLFQVDIASGAATSIGSYDFDNTWFVSGLVFGANGTLLMALGETNEVLTALTP